MILKDNQVLHVRYEYFWGEGIEFELVEEIGGMRVSVKGKILAFELKRFNDLAQVLDNFLSNMQKMINTDFIPERKKPNIPEMLKAVRNMTHEDCQEFIKQTTKTTV